MIESAKAKADLEEVSLGLVNCSMEAGFKVIGCYGDFGKVPFNEDESYHCIAVLEV